MKFISTFLNCLFISLCFLTLSSRISYGGGFLRITNTGVPYTWNTTVPVPFNPDLGGLGLLNNSEAVTLVFDGFNQWSGISIPTCALRFTNAGMLPFDVDTPAEFSSLDGVQDGLSPIIFDEDGSLFADLGFEPGVLGFASIEIITTSAPFQVIEGLAAFNGAWIDGDLSGGREITVEQFMGTFTHEAGHFLNLDHTQVNGHYFIGDRDDPGFVTYGAPPVESVNLMFPIFLDKPGETTVPLADDINWISTLYPANGFPEDYGTIEGGIFRSGGIELFQGANVIARNIDDPFFDASSNVSGALFFPNFRHPKAGAPDPALEGAYVLHGLTPGASYSIEIINVNPRFDKGSRVGPLDPPVVIPGPEEFWNGPNEAGTNPPDDPLDFESIVASSLVENIDVIINSLGVPFFPNATSTNQVRGIPFDIEVQIGDNGQPVRDLFGISFVLNYTNTDYVDVLMPYSSSCVPGPFLGSDLIFLCDVDKTNGKVSVGMSRKAGTGGVTGHGSVLKTTFVANSNTPSGTTCDFTISDILAIDSNGDQIPLIPETVKISISDVVVWPGDCDNDGTANQADILPLGLYFNQTGPPRNPDGQGCNWAGHPAQPWSNANATYVDANGDGIVNQADVLCIGLNFDHTHSTTTRLARESTVSPLSAKRATANLELQITGVPMAGELFYIEIHANEVKNLFGLAFEVDYNPTDFIDPQSVEFGGADNLLGDDLVTIDNIDKTAGVVNIGLTRKSGAGGVDGSGLVARIKTKMSFNTRIGQDTTWLSIKDVQGNDPDGNSIQFDVTNVALVPWFVDVAATPNRIIPDAFALHQNYPNPFNPETTIQYQLPKSAQVKLVIYNLAGQRVATLVDEQQPAGFYSVQWNGKDDAGGAVASGVYLYRLETKEFVQVKKLVLVR